jgi:hypothetical protein
MLPAIAVWLGRDAARHAGAIYKCVPQSLRFRGTATEQWGLFRTAVFDSRPTTELESGTLFSDAQNGLVAPGLGQ